MERALWLICIVLMQACLAPGARADDDSSGDQSNQVTSVALAQAQGTQIAGSERRALLAAVQNTDNQPRWRQKYQRHIGYGFAHGRIGAGPRSWKYRYASERVAQGGGWKQHNGNNPQKPKKPKKPKKPGDDDDGGGIDPSPSD